MGDDVFGLKRPAGLHAVTHTVSIIPDGPVDARTAPSGPLASGTAANAGHFSSGGERLGISLGATQRSSPSRHSGTGFPASPGGGTARVELRATLPRRPLTSHLRPLERYDMFRCAASLMVRDRLENSGSVGPDPINTLRATPCIYGPSGLSDFARRWQVASISSVRRTSSGRRSEECPVLAPAEGIGFRR